jgi:hypothetical protein
MSKKYLLFMIVILLLASLACSTLDGSTELASNATPTVVATPTLAPTATSDPDLPAGAGDGTAIAPEVTVDPADPAASGDPTPEGGLDPTAASGEIGDSESPDSGSGDGNGDTTAAPAACPASGQNLLLNPSFEGQFKPFGAFNELNHAPNWFPWWVDGESNLRPEFKPAEVSTAPGRVHSGSTAQQYFKSWGQFKAGLYQSVLDVPAGSNLQFSAHGQAWSCEDFTICSDGSSVNPANMLMRVGIDPTGDTNYAANTVQWSEYFNPLDQWQVACVAAVAERDIVSVFLWASPDGPRQNQDVYWDDASLVVIP